MDMRGNTGSSGAGSIFNGYYETSIWILAR